MEKHDTGDPREDRAAGWGRARSLLLLWETVSVLGVRPGPLCEDPSLFSQPFSTQQGRGALRGAGKGLSGPAYLTQLA